MVDRGGGGSLLLLRPETLADSGDSDPLLSCCCCTRAGTSSFRCDARLRFSLATTIRPEFTMSLRCVRKSPFFTLFSMRSIMLLPPASPSAPFASWRRRLFSSSCRSRFTSTTQRSSSAKKRERWQKNTSGGTVLSSPIQARRSRKRDAALLTFASSSEWSLRARTTNSPMMAWYLSAGLGAVSTLAMLSSSVFMPSDSVFRSFWMLLSDTHAASLTLGIFSPMRSRSGWSASSKRVSTCASDSLPSLLLVSESFCRDSSLKPWHAPRNVPWLR
mmetsp:Transcript_37520/g.94322  ORF Transcript_37520/g.94322 Transcript_37520/m.94322 type:complete len:274 (+) Transcript_37520:389-1210(+)